MSRYRVIWLLILISLTITLLPAAAQAPETIILTVAAPDYGGSVYTPDLFADFEAAHPGVKVAFVSPDISTAFYVSASSDDINRYLDAVRDYTTTGDVLAVRPFNFSPESTRSGYYLDLAPLVAADTSLNTADFYPVAWESFQWDRGIWALPVSFDIVTLLYLPEAFDAAGLAYPDDNWTMDDFARAARALAEKNAQGDVIRPGMATPAGTAPLFASLLDMPLYDTADVASGPRFVSPEAADMLTQWAELESEGVVISGAPEDFAELVQIPIRITTITDAGNSLPGEPVVQAALLPHHHAIIQPTGFAVSAATEHPELAYELAKYLTSSAVLFSRTFALRPARPSLLDAPEDIPSLLRPVIELSAENEAVAQEAISSGLSPAAIRYSGYLSFALFRAQNNGLNMLDALQQAEAVAYFNLDSAAARRGTDTVFVATPIPTPQITPDEVALRFGVSTFASVEENSVEFNRFVDDFVAADPEVGQLDLDLMVMGILTQMTETYDCFYTTNSPVDNPDSLLLLRNLDPFMAADPTFDSSDVIGSTLTQLTYENKIWGLPVTLHPQVMYYDAERFAETGAIPPVEGWTVNEFNDALRTLKGDSNSAPPFLSSSFGGTYLLMLMGAYGALPIDYRTTPPTYHLTDPDTLEGIRQVLNLAKDGYMNYGGLTNSASFTITFGGGNRPIYTDAMDSLSMRLIGRQHDDDPYRLTTFPRGTQFNTAAYAIGAIYISASTPNPEACYRFASAVSRRPDLFSGMPARRSLIDTTQTAHLADDLAEVYRQTVDLLEQPNTIIFPLIEASAESMGEIWIFRAFDNYVLEDGNLENDLADAENNIQAFHACIAEIPPLSGVNSLSLDNQRAYLRQFADCAERVDPSLAGYWNF
ncbi:MAG: extracellular solute-binding protein [Anaerolineae bacterium]|nr:extracellular solute-binding protein [Anaerolineae bacterium]